MSVLLLLGLARALAGPADDAYTRGVGALRDGDEAAAVEAFSEAQAAGARAPAVYHGLGNAWYREGELGRAVAVWRRGERLDPGNGDLQANLALARERVKDRLEQPAWRTGPFVWLRWLAPGQVLLFGALLVGSALSLGALSTWRRRRGQGAVLPRLGVGLGLFGLVLAASPWLSPHPDTVVVVVDELTARSALGDDAVDLFQLHEGAEVALQEEDRGHVLVALPDGRKGWLPSEAVMSTDPAAPL